MIDKKTEEEILKEIRKVRFGKVEIELTENAGHVDIITTNRKRIVKQKPYIKFEHDKTNIKHEG